MPDHVKWSEEERFKAAKLRIDFYPTFAKERNYVGRRLEGSAINQAAKRKEYTSEHRSMAFWYTCCVFVPICAIAAYLIWDHLL